MRPDAWNESREAELRLLWPTGESTSVIGAKLGVSRCAVLGKAQRLQLAGRRPRSAKPIAPKKRVSRSKVAIAERARKRAEKLAAPKVIELPRRPVRVHYSKSELRSQLTQAVRNTAAMECAI